MPDNPAGGDGSASISTPSVDIESTVHLLERARGGDRDALDRLLARHMRPLKRWARGRLPQWARDLADTDDLIQDALLQTFKRIDDFEARGPGALQAYMRQAVINRVRDELRKKGRRPDATNLDGLEIDNGMSPLAQAIGRESLERYERALATLDEDEREAIIGRVEMGYTYEELADVLGKPTSEAARKAAQRALVRLTREMDRFSEQSGDG
jgi:RNA polymerase sigma-70 factor, ECF subfamily